MKPIIHNYSDVAGQTELWDTTDSQEHYLRNVQNPDLKQQLQQRGYLDTKIEYKFNSHGFRTEEFDREFDIVCFGCSYSMGTGIHSWETWPSQLARLSGMTVANLSHAGSSNDTAFRFANHYLKWLKPKFVVWLQSDMHRLELLDDSIPCALNILASDTTNPCSNDYFIKTWFTSASNQQLNLDRNTLAFRYLCHEHNIKFIVLPRSSFPTDRGARDFRHPGPKAHAELAKVFFKQIQSE